MFLFLHTVVVDGVVVGVAVVGGGVMVAVVVGGVVVAFFVDTHRLFHLPSGGLWCHHHDVR